MSDAAHDARPTVAHVLHRLHLAGAEVLAADLARRLRERYRFVFFCLDEIGPLGHRLEGEGFKVVDLRRRPGVDLRVARRLRRECDRYGVDLLHAHQYTPFFYAAMSRRWGMGDEPKVLFTEHGRHYPDERKLRRVIANRLLLKDTDRVTAVGEFIRQALAENEGIEERRIDVIHNGIDPDGFGRSGITRPFVAEPTQDRRAARGLMGVDDDTPVVLQVARLHPVKDHATALRAFERVVQEMTSPTLVLVGDGGERANIERLIRELDLGERVRLLGVREDVARLLPGADVFLLSSVSEGISVTLLEAMAAELPIAATAVGGNPEVVDHAMTGLLSPRGDEAELAKNLLTLLRDPGLRARMGAAGRARLIEQFTQERMHAGYARVYDAMLR